MKVIFTCGGTAGHVNPALALAGQIRERQPGSEILFVGARRGIERRLIEAAGWPFKAVEVSSFHRSLKPEEIRHNLISVKNFICSPAQAREILDEFPADLVVGTDTERIQPCEVWGESRIVYSLGALIDGKNKYPETYTLVFGAELQVIDGELRNVEYSLLPCRTYDDDHPWRPLPAEDKTELRTVSEFLSGKRDTPYSEG
mgnify:CR=1 FL=1